MRRNKGYLVIGEQGRSDQWIWTDQNRTRLGRRRKTEGSEPTYSRGARLLQGEVRIMVMSKRGLCVSGAQ